MSDGQGKQSGAPDSYGESVPDTSQKVPKKLHIKENADVISVGSVAIAAKNSAKESLPLVWSGIAKQLVYFIGALLITFLVIWWGKESLLRARFLTEDALISSEMALETYKELSDQNVELCFSFAEKFVFGGLMSLVTLILGFVFGEKSAQIKNDNS